MLRLTFILWGLAFLLPLGRLQADELVGRIHGTVVDRSAAAVPGAQVKATNTETRVSTMVPAANDGSFQFLSLPIGIYDVTVSKTGFRTFTALHVPLVLNQVYEV